MDVRQEILRNAPPRDNVHARILLDAGGIIVGTQVVREEAAALNLSIHKIVEDGTRLRRGDAVVEYSGSPTSIFSSEDVLVGAMAKASGIATSANRFVEMAGDKVKIVSGAWKKMPSSLKQEVRHAVQMGGADFRITAGPFVYLDKNYVEFLGGVTESLEAVRHLKEHQKVVQIKGRYQSIEQEAIEATVAGAAIIFVDTGRYQDLEAVAAKLRDIGVRDQVRLAFGGDIKRSDMDFLKGLDVDILDIGREIVDAPLLDMKMEIELTTPDRGSGK